MEEFQRIENDEDEINYYNGCTKSKERVYCRVHVAIPDQPERRSINGLLSGGHGYHGRFGWSFDVKSQQDKMCPCSECLSSMKQKSSSDN